MGSREHHVGNDEPLRGDSRSRAEEMVHRSDTTCPGS